MRIFMPKKIGSVHVSLYVMPELRTRFKLACTANNTNMTEVIEDFMNQYALEYEIKARQA
jgi:ParG